MDYILPLNIVYHFISYNSASETRFFYSLVKKQLHSYAENASERSNLYLKAFLSDDKSTAYDLISQAEPIAEIGTNILDHINRVQEGVEWESHRSLDFKNMEAPITGMKMALSAISSFPVTIDEEIKTLLQSTQMLKLQHPKPYDDAVTVPERKHTPTLANISPTRENLPVFFFLSCFELLINANPKPESLDAQKVNIAKKTRVEKIVGQSVTKRVVFALKCSIALGLAVHLGMFFDKKNGYWSGLTIAISFVEGRLPIFTVANNRVKGTAIGSVYGVLGSCLLHQVAELRFIILLPWIVFTSMLHHSQMYGESGGIAAVISALLILGRKNYGPPKQFAIARLTEVSIGLFCMVLLEIILQPVRAATVVKLQVSQCLGTLDECLNHIASPKENIRKLKSDLTGLKNRIKDARSEPSFWYLPFKASCYDNARERLSKMVDLMQIMTYNIEFISSLSQSCDGGWKELEQHISGNLL
ncbi:putative para-hydroxybenzoic acid efflux pump subunit AaeB/fusaric acid resistance protein [Helianthus debilis subsp. tardiflorus]